MSTISISDDFTPNSPDARLRRLVAPILVYLYSLSIFGLPLAAAATAFNSTGLLLGSVVAPLVYSAVFIVVGGALSRLHQAAIVPGKFPRDVGHPIYFHRRLYGLCWTCLYYNTPVYHLVLTFPILKLIAFRLYGYKGSMAFTTYPDTWIRDLPLLDFAPGAYIANRATIGTNLALADGSTMVDRIKVGKNAVIGHLVAMAPGCVFGDDVEIGSVSAIGYRTTFGAGTSVQPRCAIEHGISFGKGSMIGASTYIGSGSRFPDGYSVAPGSVVPQRTRVRQAATLVTSPGAQGASTPGGQTGIGVQPSPA